MTSEEQLASRSVMTAMETVLGSALQGKRSVTPRFLIAFSKGCGVHTFGERQAWLDLLSQAVPDQREKAEREMRRQHRSFR
jgi:hypothetical protein